MTTHTTSVMQDDLRDLLDALGMFSGAQPQTPHEVMQGAITKIRASRIIGPEDEKLEDVEEQRLREGIRAALDELGVPNEGYPAPVVNAVDILRALLRGDET